MKLIESLLDTAHRIDGFVIRQCPPSIVKAHSKILQMIHGNNQQNSSANTERSYEPNINYSQFSTKIKTFAFYLPQFHRIKENDEWWGEGFTEWTNTKKTRPSYPGHYEPREPHNDFGYYDLTDINTLKKQIQLAKEHNINGFAYYYYWFSGRRLLEKPLDLLLSHPEIDTEFCIIWANENWTRTWDGFEKNILLAQDYSEKDGFDFIRDLKKYLMDPRYLRVKGKPVVVIYAPKLIPNLHSLIQQWRQTAKQLEIGEIEIWICRTHHKNASDLDIFDDVEGEVQFPPNSHNLAPSETIKVNGEKAYLFDYSAFVEQEIQKHSKKHSSDTKLHRTVMLEWDNSPRRNNFTSFTNFNLKDYYRWLRDVSEYTEHHFSSDDQIQFINAWNEWAEGTYLEPDVKYGYSNINFTTQAILNRPYIGQNIIYSESHKTDRLLLRPGIKIAVQAHIFYVDLLKELSLAFSVIPTPYDLYISTDKKEKKQKTEEYLRKNSTATNIYIEVFENKGRDVAPFLIQMKNRIKSYDYICHVHTKKSNTQDYSSTGDLWRKYLLHNLFGSTDYCHSLIELFEKYLEIGIIAPPTYAPLKKYIGWGANREKVNELNSKICAIENELPDTPQFPSGTMFWARTQAIAKLFESGITQSDFEYEKGQSDGTLAHAIERYWYYVALDQNYIWVNYSHKMPSTKNYI